MELSCEAPLRKEGRKEGRKEMMTRVNKYIIKYNYIL